MNNQIRELALQAGFKNGHQDSNGNSLSGELEKFAELIIEKCAQASEVYWNDAGLQRAFSPSEYIYILEVEQ